MVYMAITAAIIVLSAVLVVFAFKVLIKPTWLLGWLRGSSGIILALVAVLLIVVALDFYSYKQLEKDQSIANLSFIKLSPQQYKVSLVGSDGKELNYELRGDLWQLDARILKWAPSLSRMGLLPGYRLDRLSGRYVSLEEEKNSPRTVHSLYTNEASVFDVWAYLKEHGESFSLIESNYGNATYMPMTDGALYSVKLSHNGLVAKPLNERAKEAVSAWQ